ncbi:PEP/pyruvate-binding domain-containing protein [Desulfovibrio mangrovi]|uniref:PEP/pyruvate-binding domain-containing protein n=1 Tax=Desulfovibrio mangrovi TaxID=2976983 RepID=UPI002245C6DF|nr:PEP/pyruvate-binding domain-containing protein [Desulfovibrio mangrovi]UZP66298.1 PEP/pyruvate-binding domain-containing protein [Desulfovibrio mangrovi]
MQQFCYVHRTGTESRFAQYKELMASKVRNILLVSTPYDAWVMEEDCKLSERLVSEYRGLNLSQPPSLTWVSSFAEVPEQLEAHACDLLILMSNYTEEDLLSLKSSVKERYPDLPVVMLTHQRIEHPEEYRALGVDRFFVWTGNADLLLAIVKLSEDRRNVEHDTQFAGVRVIIMVEDSPVYISSLLPILYRELVLQAQQVIHEGLNQEHRLLAMRARPKILVAETYERAVEYFRQYEHYVLGVISDVRYPMGGKLIADAGVTLLKEIRHERADIPLLLTSSESVNAARAEEVPAFFVDKNSPFLLAEVRRFVSEQLGFGDFVFRDAEGGEIGRASSMHGVEKMLRTIPDDVFLAHCSRNDFSRWFFARNEFELACVMRPLTNADFSGPLTQRDFLLTLIRDRIRDRQRGVVVTFHAGDFDPTTDFLKTGKGSLGGKSRGLAFLFRLLSQNRWLQEKFPDVHIAPPRTLAVSVDGFDAFVRNNNLKYLAKADVPDAEIARLFLAGKMPGWLEHHVRIYLREVDYPITIRSSSLLEDAQYQAYAGLYATFMLPNNHPDPQERLRQALQAIKLVFASTYYQAPKAFSRRVKLRTDEEKMGVVIQEVVGQQYGEYFYPVISGVAQSHNYYPFGRMDTEEGVASIAMGLGKMVMDGGQTLRFSPAHPQLLPQFATESDMMRNSQTSFYSLYMGGVSASWEPVDVPPQPVSGTDADSAGEGRASGVTSFASPDRVVLREVYDAEPDGPVTLVASTYDPREGVLRDTVSGPGAKVLLFSQVLRHNSFPLPEIVKDVLDIASQAMGGPVEVEFAVDMPVTEAQRAALKEAGHPKGRFALLQLRPMSAKAEVRKVTVTEADRKRAFCYSCNALGNAERHDIRDVVFVRPDSFDVAYTQEIAREIGQMNRTLMDEGRPYLLIGFGRWGSADRWLGIPVGWQDICGVAAMIETSTGTLKVEPSQGSHFFHNITTLGINYIMVGEKGEERIDWDWLAGLPEVHREKYISRVQLDTPLHLKVDGRTSQCVIMVGSETDNVAPDGPEHAAKTCKREIKNV